MSTIAYKQPTLLLVTYTLSSLPLPFLVLAHSQRPSPMHTSTLILTILIPHIRQVN